MEFIASLYTLPEIMGYIRERANVHGIVPSLINKMELACEEAIVNIISYAYKNKQGKVFIECKKQGKRFEIILRDQGVPFNPIDADVNPQFNTPILKRKVGGMGIFLMRKTIDEVCYQRVENENVLRLAFNLP